MFCTRTQHSPPDESRAFCVLFIIVSISYFTCQSFWMAISFIEFCYSVIPFGKLKAWCVWYSKTCVKRPLSKTDTAKILMTKGSLMKGKSNAECFPWSILHYFWAALSDDWSWKPICGLFESDRFTQVLLKFLNPYPVNIFVLEMSSAFTSAGYIQRHFW